MPKCLKIIFSEFILLTLISFLSVFFLIGSETSRVYAATYTSCSDLYDAFGSGTTITVSVNTTLQAAASNYNADDSFGVIDCSGYDVVINNGVTLTIDSYNDGDTDYTDDYGVMIKADSLTVNGIISANGDGYVATKGPGTGGSFTGGSQNGSGGGYGGDGAQGTSGKTIGPSYGSAIAPIALGSGGGTGSNDGAGGTGGGAIKLDISGDLIISGSITANGNTGAGTYWGGGGGSGGSVYIITDGTLSGSGTITATGGAAHKTDCCNDPGVGGGGRIAIYYNTYDAATNSLDENTAANGADGWSTRDGQAGTVGFFKMNNTPNTLTDDDLYIYQSYEFVKADAIDHTFTYQSITIDGSSRTEGGEVRVETDATAKNLQINGNLSIDDSVLIPEVNTTFTVTGNVDITETSKTTNIYGLSNNGQYSLNFVVSGYMDLGANATIDYSGDGFAAATGTGAGSSNTGVDQNGSGGAHGGDGAQGTSGKTAGSSYGSAITPITVGSGGGNGSNAAGGAGGGAVKLDVNGNLTVDGSILANGNNGSGNYWGGGGGAGGSIYLITDGILNGNGTITSSGGGANTADGSNGPGGGGGGRIAIYYNTFDPTSSTLDENTTALGGDGWGTRDGQTGTVGFFRMYNTPETLTDDDLFVYKTYEFTAVDAVSDTWTYNNVTLSGATVRVGADAAGKIIDINNNLSLTNSTIDLEVDTTFDVEGNTDLVYSSATTSIFGNSSGNQIDLLMQITGNLNVGSTTSINLNGDGFTSATGTGAGGSSTNGGGGGHGGAGAIGTYAGATAGATYGSNTSPITHGSGGGTGTDGAGGAGGGVIKLEVEGNLVVDGIVSANGNTGSGATYRSGGGGAGGSIYAVVNGAISGAGNITANGGQAGYNASDPANGAGGGGGGRIAIYGDGTLPTLSVVGGDGYSTYDGNAGTTFTGGKPDSPTITLNSENIIKNISTNPTLIGSDYAGDGSHINSDWKIVSTNNCTNGTLVWSKNDDTTNKTSITINAENGNFTGALSGSSNLDYNTTYYSCVRYNNSVDSNWSSPKSFITQKDNTGAVTYNWDFNTSSEYTVAIGKTQINGGVGSLVDLGGGTYTTAPYENIKIDVNNYFINSNDIISFTQTSGLNYEGQAKYHLSCDGASWYYHPSGEGSWTLVDEVISTNMSTASVVNGYIGDFISDIGGTCNGGLRLRAYLISTGNQAVEVDNVAIKYFGPATPTITSPLDAAISINRSPTITSSAFSGSYIHLSSDWEIYDNVGLDASNRVWYKTNDEINKTSIVVNSTNGTFENSLSGNSKLNPNTQYFVRARHKNSQGYSGWSNSVSFTSTVNNVPATPTNESPSNNATGVVFTPALSASSYSDADNDSHLETQWLVYNTSDDCTNNTFGSAVINLSSLTNLTSYVVSPSLLSNSTYYWRMRYKDQYNDWSNYSSCTSFNTLATMPDNPVNLLPADSAVSVALNATLQATDFNDDDGDSHQSSQWLIYSSNDNCTNNLSPITDSSTDNVNLTAYTVGLSGNSTYYWRVRYQDNHNNWTDYSTCTSFSTLATTPSTPTNQTPANAAVDVAIRPTLAASAFSDADGDTHLATQWQVFTSSDDCTNNTNSSVNSGTDSVNLTSLIVNQGIQPLTGNTQYFWRVRYQDIRNNWTDYSSCTSFTTIPTVPDQPTITSIANGSTNIKRRPTITGSSYVSPQPHLSSDVQLSTDAAFGSVIADCVDYVGDNKESLIVNPSNCVFTPSVQALDINTEYFVRLRYSNSNGDSIWSNTVSFTTTYPRVIQNISNQTWNKNTSLASAFNLDNHFALTEGEAITYTVLNTPQFITITINLNHSVSFSASANKTGEAAVIFRMTDAYGSFIDSNPVTLLVIDPDVGSDLGSKDNIPDLPDDDPDIDDLPDDPQDPGISLPGEDEHDSPDEDNPESKSGEDEAPTNDDITDPGSDPEIEPLIDSDIIDYPDFEFDFPEEDLEIIDIVDDGIDWEYDLPLTDGLKPIIVDTNLPDDEIEDVLPDDENVIDNPVVNPVDNPEDVIINIPEDKEKDGEIKDEEIKDEDQDVPEDKEEENKEIEDDNNIEDIEDDNIPNEEDTLKEVAEEDSDAFKITVPTLVLIYDDKNIDNGDLPDNETIPSKTITNTLIGQDYEITVMSDKDNDGVSDLKEMQIGSDPHNRDSDRDGISDYDEIEMSLMVNNPDSDYDGFCDLIEIEAGSDPLKSSSVPNDLNGNQINDDWEKEFNIEVLNGWQDTDADGCSDKIEYQYLSNPLNIDSDNDGYLDCEEILEFRTDPMDFNSKPDKLDELKITNWNWKDSTNDFSPLFKGTGPKNINIELWIEGGDGQKQNIASSKIFANNKFVIVPKGKIKDGNYVFYVNGSHNGKIMQSNRILLSIDSKLGINKPEVKRLGSVNILKDVRLEIREGRPILLGKVQEKAEVIVTWSSLLYTSALLIDTKEGDFQSIPPTLLEKGDHKIYLYAYRPNDKSSSQHVKLEFEILEGGIIKIHNDYNVWIFVIAAISCIAIISISIYINKRKKRKTVENASTDITL